MKIARVSVVLPLDCVNLKVTRKTGILSRLILRNTLINIYFSVLPQNV